MSNKQELECCFCKSSLEQDVVKCRHCGEWVKGAKLSLKNPNMITVIIMIVVFLAIAGTSRYFTYRIMRQGSQMYSYLDKDSTEIMLTSNENKDKNIVIFGEIHNKSKFTYHSLDVSVMYYDSSNKLIDVAKTYIPSLTSQNMAPYEIRIKEKEIMDIHKYHHFEMKINGAYRYNK